MKSSKSPYISREATLKERSTISPGEKPNAKKKSQTATSPLPQRSALNYSYQVTGNTKASPSPIKPLQKQQQIQQQQQMLQLQQLQQQDSYAYQLQQQLLQQQQHHHHHNQQKEQPQQLIGTSSSGALHTKSKLLPDRFYAQHSHITTITNSNSFQHPPTTSAHNPAATLSSSHRVTTNNNNNNNNTSYPIRTPERKQTQSIHSHQQPYQIGVTNKLQRSASSAKRKQSNGHRGGGGNPNISQNNITNNNDMSNISEEFEYLKNRIKHVELSNSAIINKITKLERTGAPTANPAAVTTALSTHPNHNTSEDFLPATTPFQAMQRHSIERLLQPPLQLSQLQSLQHQLPVQEQVTNESHHKHNQKGLQKHTNLQQLLQQQQQQQSLHQQQQHQQQQQQYNQQQQQQQHKTSIEYYKEKYSQSIEDDYHFKREIKSIIKVKDEEIHQLRVQKDTISAELRTALHTSAALSVKNNTLANRLEDAKRKLEEAKAQLITVLTSNSSLTRIAELEQELQERDSIIEQLQEQLQFQQQQQQSKESFLIDDETSNQIQAAMISGIRQRKINIERKRDQLIAMLQNAESAAAITNDLNKEVYPLPLHKRQEVQEYVNTLNNEMIAIIEAQAKFNSMTTPSFRLPKNNNNNQQQHPTSLTTQFQSNVSTGSSANGNHIHSHSHSMFGGMKRAQSSGQVTATVTAYSSNVNPSSSSLNVNQLMLEKKLEELQALLESTQQEKRQFFMQVEAFVNVSQGQQQSSTLQQQQQQSQRSSRRSHVFIAVNDYETVLSCCFNTKNAQAMATTNVLACLNCRNQREQIEHQEKAIRDIQLTFDDLSRRYESEKVQGEDKKSDLLHQIEVLNEQIHSLSQQLRETSLENERLQQEQIKILNEQSQEIDNNNSNNKNYATLFEMFQKEQVHLTELIREKDVLEERLSESQREGRSLRAKNDKANAENGKLQRMVLENNQSIASLNKQLEQTPSPTELLSLQSQVESLETQLANATRSLESSKQDTITAENSIEELKEQLESLGHRYASLNNTQREEIHNKDIQLRKLQIRIQSLSEKSQSATNALPPQQQQQQQQQQQPAQQLRSTLSVEEPDKCLVFRGPNTSRDESTVAAAVMAQNSGCIHSASAQTIIQTIPASVSIPKEKINPIQANQIAVLKEKVSALTAELKACKDNQLSNTTATNESILLAVNNSNSPSKTIISEATTTTTTIVKLQETIQECESRIELLVGQLSDTETKLEVTLTQNNELQVTVSSLQNQFEDISRSHEEQMQREKDESKNFLIQYKNTIQSLQEQMNNFITTIDELKQLNCELESNVNQKIALLAETEQKLDILQKEFEQLNISQSSQIEQLNSQSREQVVVFELQVQQLNDEVNQLKRSNVNSNEELMQKKQVIDTLRNELRVLESTSSASIEKLKLDNEKMAVAHMESQREQQQELKRNSDELILQHESALSDQQKSFKEITQKHEETIRVQVNKIDALHALNLQLNSSLQSIHQSTQNKQLVELAQVQKQFEDSQETLQSTLESLKQVQSQLVESEKRSSEELSQAIRDVEWKKNDELLDAKAELTRVTEEYQSRIYDLEKQQKNSQKQLNDRSIELESINQQVAQLTQEAELTSEKINALLIDVQSKDAEIARMQQQQNNLKESFEDLTKKELSLQEEIRAAEQTIRELKQTIEEKEEQVVEVVELLNVVPETQKEEVEVQHEIEEQNKIDSLELMEEIEGNKATIAQLEIQLSDLNVQKTQLEEQLVQNRVDLEEQLRDVEQKQQTILTEKDAVINSKQMQISELQSKWIEFESNKSQAISLLHSRISELESSISIASQSTLSSTQALIDSHANAVAAAAAHLDSVVNNHKNEVDSKDQQITNLKQQLEQVEIQSRTLISKHASELQLLQTAQASEQEKVVAELKLQLESEVKALEVSLEDAQVMIADRDVLITDLTKKFVDLQQRAKQQESYISAKTEELKKLRVEYDDQQISLQQLQQLRVRIQQEKQLHSSNRPTATVATGGGGNPPGGNGAQTLRGITEYQSGNDFDDFEEEEAEVLQQQIHALKLSLQVQSRQIEEQEQKISAFLRQKQLSELELQNALDYSNSLSSALKESQSELQFYKSFNGAATGTAAGDTSIHQNQQLHISQLSKLDSSGVQQTSRNHNNIRLSSKQQQQTRSDRRHRRQRSSPNINNNNNSEIFNNKSQVFNKNQELGEDNLDQMIEDITSICDEFVDEEEGKYHNDSQNDDDDVNNNPEELNRNMNRRGEYNNNDNDEDSLDNSVEIQINLCDFQSVQQHQQQMGEHNSQYVQNESEESPEISNIGRNQLLAPPTSVVPSQSQLSSSRRNGSLNDMQMPCDSDRFTEELKGTIADNRNSRSKIVFVETSESTLNANSNNMPHTAQQVQLLQKKQMLQQYQQQRNYISSNNNSSSREQNGAQQQSSSSSLSLSQSQYSTQVLLQKLRTQVNRSDHTKAFIEEMSSLFRAEIEASLDSFKSLQKNCLQAITQIQGSISTRVNTEGTSNEEIDLRIATAFQKEFVNTSGDMLVACLMKLNENFLSDFIVKINESLVDRIVSKVNSVFEMVLREEHRVFSLAQFEDDILEIGDNWSIDLAANLKAILVKLSNKQSAKANAPAAVPLTSERLTTNQNEYMTVAAVSGELKKELDGLRAQNRQLLKDVKEMEDNENHLQNQMELLKKELSEKNSSAADGLKSTLKTILPKFLMTSADSSKSATDGSAVESQQFLNVILNLLEFSEPEKEAILIKRHPSKKKKSWF